MRLSCVQEGSSVPTGWMPKHLAAVWVPKALHGMSLTDKLQTQQTDGLVWEAGTATGSRWVLTVCSFDV